MFPVLSTPSATPARAHRECALQAASVRFADHLVLDRIDLVVGPADRLAVIGDNGAGKSTLLDLLAGTLLPTAGEVRLDLPGGVAHARQHPVFADGATVADAIDELLGDLRALEHDLGRAYDLLAAAGSADREPQMAAVALLQDRFESRGGYDVDRRIDTALEQLGVGGVDRARPVAALSGGERARLALAVALSSGAELLLLDEPTNDLDDRALTWLEDRLAAHRGALVVVTHDRDFLDRFATAVVQVEDGRIRRYGDGYPGFLRAHAAERRAAAARHEDWKAEVARTESLLAANAFRLQAIPRKLELDGFGHGAFRARSRDHGAVGRIRMAKERLARLRDNPCPPPPEPLQFVVAAEDRAPLDEPGEPLLTLDAVSFREPGRRLDVSHWTIESGSRWLVTGPNGAGKTTLLRLLVGELLPASGTFVRRDGLRIAFLRQEVETRLRGTALEVFAVRTGTPPVDARDALLAHGLFRGPEVDRDVRGLSMGQRRRLDLAVALASRFDLLLLDEPTNHLDPELVEQLEGALVDHPAAVITVTHDRRWRRHATDARRVRVEEGVATT
ncbi:ABC-F family ATP-binding cassette domain-containing protein [Microbacterium algeriense]|uniref:ABC-F family ATP-binding cassette domain-containing protein n=1 Tax=Microbacterium algeriense TaxID=2615184 RepID=UPI0029B82C86|nr:ABC-F family ATP-binding cassette domain-containing protein [Microbacterium algeriense]MDX2400458.1 ATP-binding cassette domain-containing protein [Microbacterium algeriense]